MRSGPICTLNRKIWHSTLLAIMLKFMDQCGNCEQWLNSCILMAIAQRGCCHFFAALVRKAISVVVVVVSHLLCYSHLARWRCKGVSMVPFIDGVACHLSPRGRTAGGCLGWQLSVLYYYTYADPLRPFLGQHVQGNYRDYGIRYILVRMMLVLYPRDLRSTYGSSSKGGLRVRQLTAAAAAALQV